MPPNKRKSKQQNKRVQVSKMPPPIPSRMTVEYRKKSRRAAPRPRSYGSSGPSYDGALGRAAFKSQRGGVGIKNTDRIREREFIATINGSVAYSVFLSVALNPGLAASFPWLSTQALGWESYRFNKLRFCYYSRKGSSTDGSVIMGPDYDAADAAPPDEATFCTYQDVQEFSPWVIEFCVDLNSAQLNKIGKYKFVRTGVLPTNMVLADTDSGNFHIATVGMADASAIGKLWVEYDVTFQTKQKNVTTTAPTNSKVSTFSGTTAQTTGTPTILPIAAVTNPLGVAVAAGVLTPPAGNYIVSVVGAVNATTNFTSQVVTLLKNAANVDANQIWQSTQAAAAIMTAGGFTQTGFVSMNGTDTLKIQTTIVGTGTLNSSGYLVLTAI